MLGELCSAKKTVQCCTVLRELAVLGELAMPEELAVLGELCSSEKTI